jgi:hypothetical protein
MVFATDGTDSCFDNGTACGIYAHNWGRVIRGHRLTQILLSATSVISG